MRNWRERRLVTAVAFGMAILGGCVHQEAALPPPPEPTPLPPAFSESALPADARARIEVVDFHDEPTADKKHVTVGGKLINRGHATSLELRVKITSVDKDNNPIDHIEVLPSNELVPPGGTANFKATLPNRPEVVRYHVQVVAR